MKDMQNLDANNGVLNEKTLSSMEMTKVIDTQVKGVADLMEQVVDLIGNYVVPRLSAVSHQTYKMIFKRTA